MKLIVQIPCYNEEETIGLTVRDIPRNINGIDCVEILVINDGSNDKTVEAAKEAGVDYIVSHSGNLGLARAFETGLKKSIESGADIIVNLDADNQYKASDIPKLIRPLIDKKSDITIGARPIEMIKTFSPVKKILQKLGSCAIRKISGTDVQDAPSGFRAFTKEAAMKINIFDNYTYTMETIIQAQNKGLIIQSVPIGVNTCIRPSRLVKNNFDYIRRSALTIIRFVIVYKPFKFFIKLSLFLFLFGALLGIRFLYFYLIQNGSGHIQSLILCAILILIAVQSVFFAVIADLLAINRRLIEDIQIRIRKNEQRL